MEPATITPSLTALDRTLVSYDASGSARSRAARACQIVLGYDRRVYRDGVTRLVHTEGYLDRPDARWIGQSVVLLRHADARALAKDLLRLGLRVQTFRIRVRSEDLSRSDARGRHPF